MGGVGGLVNFGLFGFYMLGAYIAGLADRPGIASPLGSLALAMVGVALVSAVSALISVRLSEDYLAIVTLGFAECLRLVISYEAWLTQRYAWCHEVFRPAAVL